MDSELRYGLGYVLAWPFLKDSEEIWVGQALGAGFLNRLPLPDVRRSCQERWFRKFAQDEPGELSPFFGRRTLLHPLFNKW